MSEKTSHADRVNPPATFYAGHGVSMKVWAANDKNKYPQAFIEQSYQKEGSEEWITNKVYIDNRTLLALALSCQDAHREVSRQLNRTAPSSEAANPKGLSGRGRNLQCEHLLHWLAPESEVH
jgi:hypothetical protein